MSAMRLSRQQLTAERFHQWDLARKPKLVLGMRALLESAHDCWMPHGNNYTEHDIGNKNVRYPNGKTRSVRVTKVRDTGGVTFYSFAANIPLS